MGVSEISTLCIQMNILYENVFLGLKNPATQKLYKKTNQRVETVCRVIDVISLKILAPGFVLPKAIFSYFQYFRTDLGPDAFELSLPVWYVILNLTRE